MGQANISLSPEDSFTFLRKNRIGLRVFFPQFNVLDKLTKGSRTSEPIQGALERGGSYSQQANAPEVKPFPDSSDLIDVLCQCHEITPPFVA